MDALNNFETTEIQTSTIQGYYFANINSSNNNNNNEMGVQLDTKHWYEHVPKSVETPQG